MNNVKRYLLIVFISLFAGMILSPLAAAANAPAAVQYEYDPVVKASGDQNTGATLASSDESGAASRFPLLLIGAIVLILGAFGAKVALDRRRDHGPPLGPTVPLALMGGILIAVLALGAGGTTAAPNPKAPPGFLNIAPQSGTSVNDAARMAKGGVKVIKVPFSWALVQAGGPNSFDWGLYDIDVRNAAVSGLSVLPVLYGTPPWLASRTTALPKTAKQIRSWRRFVAAAVQRYGNNGSFWDEPAQAYTYKTPPKSWQLWNEVNFHYFAFPVSAKAYGRMVNAAAPVVRANDSRAGVMLSGFFARPKGPPKKAVHATKFVRQLSRYVKPKVFDSLALHPYTADTKQLGVVIRDFRRAANRAGYRSKPINITEIGWGSGKATNAFLKGSQAKQATQLKSALGYLIKVRRKYKIKGVYWYTWKDSDPKGVNCSFCYSTGLFKFVKAKLGTEPVLRPKPAWRTFVKLTGGRSR